MQQLHGRVVTPQGIVQGSLRFDSRITAIDEAPSSGAKSWILPGFIDLHVHGGGGADCMNGVDEVRQMAAFHAQYGTTTLLATTMTDHPKAIQTAFAGIAEAIAKPSTKMAKIAGVHLEGPFINPDALGAQPPLTQQPDPHLIACWHEIAPIRVATIAPEIDEARLLLGTLLAVGAKVQMGHTCASYAQASAALEDGYAGFTHLFNAMTGFHHRVPGVAGCALAQGQHAEMIMDLLHVSPAAIQAALRAIPHLYAITDASAAAGMPDGTYRLGVQNVQKRGDRVTLPNSETIAGSVLTMDRAFANLVALGLGVCEASRRCSGLQADYLGLQECGHIGIGMRADLVVLSPDLQIEQVFIGGQAVIEER